MEAGLTSHVDLRHNEKLRSLTFDLPHRNWEVLRNIPLLIPKISIELREIVFKGASGKPGTPEDWLGVADALNNIQTPNLTKIHFCSLDNPHGEALKTFLQNQMARCDVRGILNFRELHSFS